MSLTHAQRFDIIVTPDRVFAPLTIGAPAMLFATDYSVFEKTPEEKWKLYNFKKRLGKTKHHKFVISFKGQI